MPHLLLVDDDPEALEWLSELAKGEGFTVAQADSLRAAGNHRKAAGQINLVGHIVPLTSARKLADAWRLGEARRRKAGAVAWLRPDAKSQVSVRYEDHQPVAATRVVVSPSSGSS